MLALRATAVLFAGGLREGMDAAEGGYGWEVGSDGESCPSDVVRYTALGSGSSCLCNRGWDGRVVQRTSESG